MAYRKGFEAVGELTPEEDAFVNSVPSENFGNECLECWRDAGKPVLPGMYEIILEEYNNSAITALVANGYETGQLKEPKDGD